MTRLHAWLTLYGKQIEDNLWIIKNYNRVATLLLIWDGPFITTSKGFILDIDYDGKLKGRVESIREEIELMPNNYDTLIDRWICKCDDREFILVNF